MLLSTVALFSEKLAFRYTPRSSRSEPSGEARCPSDAMLLNHPSSFLLALDFDLYNALESINLFSDCLASVLYKLFFGIVLLLGQGLNSRIMRCPDVKCNPSQFLTCRMSHVQLGAFVFVQNFCLQSLAEQFSKLIYLLCGAVLKLVGVFLFELCFQTTIDSWIHI